MRSMVDKCKGDPYTEVALALHDALAHQNRWIDYTKEQYQVLDTKCFKMIYILTINPDTHAII
jgi:hypothetical protein